MSSYYQIIDGQRYDRRLLELANSFTKGRGEYRISFEEAQRLWAAAADGRGITPTELSTFQYLLQQLPWTDKSRSWMQAQLPPELSERAQTTEALLDRLQIEGLCVVYDETDIEEQEQLANNTLDYYTALAAALKSFLEDGTRIESPRSIIRETFGLFPDRIPDAEAQIATRLRDFLQSGELQLLPNEEWDEEEDYDFTPPEDRESTTENWIFSLRLPQLSDHIYWVVVDRSGKRAPYNYGFN